MNAPVTENSLKTLIKAYDVRGVVPDQLDENLAFQIGQAFVEVLKLRNKKKSQLNKKMNKLIYSSNN